MPDIAGAAVEAEHRDLVEQCSLFSLSDGQVFRKLVGDIDHATAPRVATIVQSAPDPKLRIVAQSRLEVPGDVQA